MEGGYFLLSKAGRTSVNFWDRVEETVKGKMEGKRWTKRARSEAIAEHDRNENVSNPRYLLRNGSPLEWK